MSAGRVAAISDVHGNRWALEAVLTDISKRGIESVVNLGDSLYGPLDPSGTAGLLMDAGMPAVGGNEDRILIETDEEDPAPPLVARVRAELGGKALDWLAGLPSVSSVSGLLLCHGTPSDDTAYLLESIGPDGAPKLRTPEELDAFLAGVDERVVLCGHSHLPNHARTSRGRLVVNPGSVGLQAFRDDVPRPHRIETGEPHARYAIVEPVGGDWRIEHVSVRYDWDRAARRADERGRRDWAVWLRTGRAA